MQRKKGARAGEATGRESRGKRSPSYHGMPRAAVKGICLLGAYWVSPDGASGEDGRGSGCIKRLWQDARMGLLMENHDAQRRGGEVLMRGKGARGGALDARGAY